MARIIKRICLMTIVFLVAISIKVYANELSIDCQDSINPETENTLEYVFKGNFTDNVNSIKVRYIIPDGVEFQGFTPSGEWNLEQGGTAETTGFILRINEGDLSGEVEFGKFTFSVPSTYNKDAIALKIYELDATNTSCEIVEFSEDEVIKSVQIEKQNNDDNPSDVQEDDNNSNNPSDDNNSNNGDNNNNGGNGEQENNNPNTPTDSEDDKDKNGEHGENTNANGSDKNNNGSNNSNSDIGNASAGSKNSNNSLNPKSNNEKDATVTKTPFGQYGNGKIIMILIVIVSGIGVVAYRKFEKVKFIK